jgi:hypothetical protein
MILFLLTAMPLFFAFTVLLPWDGQKTPRRLFIVFQFLRGVVLFFPAWLILLVLRRIAGFAYSGFPLFLSLLARDHLPPILLAVGGFLLVMRAVQYPSSDEGVFLATVSFMSGFFAMMSVADFIAGYGRWDAHALFLLPLSRVAGVLFLSAIARRYERWEGRAGLAYFGVAAGVSVLACSASFLLVVNRGLFAFVMVAIFLAASVLFAAAMHPRVVLGRSAP